MLIEKERNRDREEGWEGRTDWARMQKVARGDQSPCQSQTFNCLLNSVNMTLSKSYTPFFHLESVWGRRMFGGGALEESDGGPVVFRRWHWHWLQKLRSGARNAKQQMWERKKKTLLQAWCGAHLETVADRQSSKRWPIKDWKSLEHQVLGWGGAD